MKKSLLIFSFFCLAFTSSIYGQLQDSLQIEYSDEFALGNEIPVDFQITVTNLGFSEILDTELLSARFGFEKKIKDRFSLYVETEAIKLSDGIPSLKFTIEPRMFFSLKKGGYANPNLNGLYLGFGLSNSNLEDFLTTYLRVGYQSRLLKYGYFDWGINAGIGNDFDFAPNPVYIIGPTLKFGLAYSPDYEFNFENRKCDILKCYDEINYWLRMDLLSLFNFTSSTYFINWGSNLDIDFEHKIAKPNITLNHDFEISYSYSKFDAELIDFYMSSESIRFSYIPEVRVLLGKRKSIAKGKSANNMNGVFLGFAGALFYKLERESNISGQQLDFNKSVELGGGMTLGFQGKLLKNFFYEIKTVGLLTVEQDLDANDLDLRITFIPDLNFGYIF